MAKIIYIYCYMKLYLQKRLVIDKCHMRKSPRLYADIRLQCVLSGNQVIYLETIYPSIKGEPPFGNERFDAGKTYLT